MAEFSGIIPARYAFRREILEEVVKLPSSALELAESLEQISQQPSF